MSAVAVLAARGNSLAVWFGLLVACGNGNAPAPPPTLVARHPEAPSRVVTERFHSAALGVDKQLLVYLPRGYDPTSTRQWPVYYYLHGLGGDETNWIEFGKLDRVADDLGIPAIVVMPDGDDGFYVDSAHAVDFDACTKDGTGLFMETRSKATTCVTASHYETYITRDLVAWIDRTYRTIANRSGRGIAGLSMGGYGALVLAMRHPELFAAAASHSGLDVLTYAGPYPYATGKGMRFADPKQWAAGLALLGFGRMGDWMLGIFGEDIANWQAHDPATLVEQLGPGTLKLYLDCGTEDAFQFHNGMQYLHDLLIERHIDHEYYLGPGGHDFEMFAARLPHSLAFLRASVAPPSK